MNCGELREERASEGENQTKPEEQDGATLPYTLEIKKKIHLAALLQQRVAAPWGQTDKVEKKNPTLFLFLCCRENRNNLS